MCKYFGTERVGLWPCVTIETKKNCQDYLLMRMKKSEGNIYPTLIIDLVEAYNHHRLSSSLMLYEQEKTSRVDLKSNHYIQNCKTSDL
jgi:hypothetical protein